MVVATGSNCDLSKGDRFEGYHTIRLSFCFFILLFKSPIIFFCTIATIPSVAINKNNQINEEKGWFWLGNQKSRVKQGSSLLPYNLYLYIVLYICSFKYLSLWVSMIWTNNVKWIFILNRFHTSTITSKSHYHTHHHYLEKNYIHI